MSSSTAAASIIYLGLDVHKDSVTIAVLPADATAPTRIDKYPNDFAKLRRVLERQATGGVKGDKRQRDPLADIQVKECRDVRTMGFS